MKLENKKNPDFVAGQKVKIISGPGTNHTGVVLYGFHNREGFRLLIKSDAKKFGHIVSRQSSVRFDG